MIARLSEHGIKRARERLGLPKRALMRNVEKAFVSGISYKEVTGALGIFLNGLASQQSGDAEVRIYGYNVYIYRRDSFITVFTLPNEYHHTVDRIKKRRNCG